MKFLKWILPALLIIASIGIFGFTNNYVPLTHPKSLQKYNENPSPLYKDNSTKDNSKFITKEQAIKKVVRPKSAITKSAKLETWSTHIKEDEPNSKTVDYQVSPNRKVWVIKTYYPDGMDTKIGFYNKATLISVFDAKTATLLESTVSGDNQEKPSLHHKVKNYNKSS